MKQKLLVVLLLTSTALSAQVFNKNIYMEQCQTRQCITQDQSQNIVMLSMEQITSTNIDLKLVKYDRAGNFVNAQVVDIPNKYLAPGAIINTWDDEFLVTGNYLEVSVYPWFWTNFIARFDNNLNLLWLKIDYDNNPGGYPFWSGVFGTGIAKIDAGPNETYMFLNRVDDLSWTNSSFSLKILDQTGNYTASRFFDFPNDYMQPTSIEYLPVTKQFAISGHTSVTGTLPLPFNSVPMLGAVDANLNIINKFTEYTNFPGHYAQLLTSHAGESNALEDFDPDYVMLTYIIDSTYNLTSPPCYTGQPTPFGALVGLKLKSGDFTNVVDTRWLAPDCMVSAQAGTVLRHVNGTTAMTFSADNLLSLMFMDSNLDPLNMQQYGDGWANTMVVTPGDTPILKAWRTTSSSWATRLVITDYSGKTDCSKDVKVFREKIPVEVRVPDIKEAKRDFALKQVEVKQWRTDSGDDDCYTGGKESNKSKDRKITIPEQELMKNKGLAPTSISIFPSPVASNGYITISSPLQVKEVLVYDMQGRVIDKQQVNIQTRNMLHITYPTGVYMIHITDVKGNMHVQKLQVF